MRRLAKTKRGFTLVEILMVIAIIIILAAAVGISANDILNNSKRASSSVDVAASSVAVGISASENRLQGYGF